MRIRYLFILTCILVLHTSLQAASVGSVDIHGFISQGYMQSNENNYDAETKEGSFQFNEMGINFGTKLSPKLRVGIQLFARDLGDIGNDEVTLDWVFGDYRWQEWLGIRVGKVKLPLGLYNEIRDIDLVRTFINLPQSIYHEKFRDTWIAVKGAGVYGKVGSDAIGTLGYQFVMGSMAADKASGAAKYFESLTGGICEVTQDFDFSMNYSGKIEWYTPVIPLHLATSILAHELRVDLRIKEEFFPTPVEGYLELNDFIAIVNSAEYIWRDLTLVFECMTTESDTHINLTSSLDYSSSMLGYYGSMAYRFLHWLEVGTYYSVFYFDKSDKDGKKFISMSPLLSFKKDFQSWSKDACLTARFDINRNWIIKLEGHLINGAADLFDMDNYDEDTPILNSQPVLDIEEDWMLFAAKVSYTF